MNQLLRLCVVLSIATGCATRPERKPWREAFPGESFVTVEGVDVHFEKTGKGPAVVLLHGIADSMVSYRFLAPLLSAHYTVYRVDLRGSGHSERPWPADYSVQAMARFVGRFLDAVDVKRAALVGSSWGGVFALELASRCPNRIVALVPIGTMAYREPVNLPLALRALRWPGARWLAPAFVTRAQVRTLFDEYMFSPGYPHTAERAAAFSENLERENGKRVLVALTAGWTPDQHAALEASYPTLAVPTLILWGDKDAFFPLAQPERLHREIPRSELVILEGGSHSIIEEQPAPVADALLRFLDRQPRW